MSDQARSHGALPGEFISAILDDQRLSDPVIVFARGALPQQESDYADKSVIEAAIGPILEQHQAHQKNDDLTALAQTHFALGLCYLIVGSGDDALESLQICAEMSEAHDERITQAWALAFHGLTKRFLYELLEEDGRLEIDRARDLFEKVEHQAGTQAIDELFLGMSE